MDFDSPPSPKLRRSERLHRNVSPLVVFAHGAGAPSSSDWMIRWKYMLRKALCAVEVVTFDYPYLSGGKKRPPPKAEKLVDFHVNVVKKAVAKYPGHPLVLAGKSMGSRMKGSKDGLCPLDMLETVRSKLKVINNLAVIEGGQHSFEIAKKHLLAAGSTQNDVEESAVKSIASFVTNCLCQGAIEHS